MRVRKAASERNEKKSRAQMLHFSDVQFLYDMRYDITDNGSWILSHCGLGKNLGRRFNVYLNDFMS